MSGVGLIRLATQRQGSVNAAITGTMTRRSTAIATSPRARRFDPNQWNTYAECGSFPRYRHANSTNASFVDGHAKAMARGSILWYNNIYLPGIMPNAY